jgi:hypothetical protein
MVAWHSAPPALASCIREKKQRRCASVLTKGLWTAAPKEGMMPVSTMRTKTKLRVAQEVEPQRGEADAADMLPYFAEKASAERVKPGRGAVWGLILGCALWIAILALVSFFRR